MDLKSGYPYWLIRSGLPFRYPRLEKNTRTDILIIGGGISGALSAYHLVQAGMNCMVIDARTIGLGSTCASTSLLQYELDKPLYQLAALIGKKKAERAYILCGEAVEKIRQIAGEIGFDGYEKRNSLYYAAYKKDVSLIRQEYEARKQAGFKVDLFDEQDIKKRYSFSAPAAILSHHGACIDAYMFTHALHQFGIKEGLQVFDRTTAKEIQYGKNGVKVITQDGYTIRARKILNATGYEAELFLGKKVAALHSTYAVISEHLPAHARIWKDKEMIWNTADPYLYLRANEENRIIVGGRDEHFYNPVARNRLLKHKSKQLTGDFKKLFPHIDFVPEFSWTGTFGVTKDSLPFIGINKKIPHTCFALGFGGNGITFSLIAAAVTRDLLRGKPNRDAALFSFDRA